MSHVCKIVDDDTPSNTVHFDPVEGTSPPGDIKIIPERPVLIERRKRGADHTDRIHDGTEPDEIAFNVKLDHDTVKDDTDQLREWRKHAYDGTYVLTFYSDEYQSGIIVEILGFDFVKPKGTSKRTYEIAITLVKIP